MTSGMLRANTVYCRDRSRAVKCKRGRKQAYSRGLLDHSGLEA